MALKKVDAQLILDIILPKEFNMRTNGGPNDKEANALYDLWKGSPSGCDSFEVPDNNRHYINSWKASGLVEGFSGSLNLTDKGKKLIIEMVTNQPNSFSKEAKAPKYSEVRAKKSMSNIKRASKEESKGFNLRRSKWK